MTKKQLFTKYSINKSHSKWDNDIDNWMSVEIYRITHDGNLPPKDDLSIGWVTDFLDISNNDPGFWRHIMNREDWGSLYLTAKRMIYRYADEIIKP